MQSKEQIWNQIIQNWNQIISDQSSLRDATISLHREALPHHYDEQHKLLTISIREDKWQEKYEEYNLKQFQKAIKKATELDVTCKYIKYKVKFDIDSIWLKNSIDFALNSLNHMTQNDFQRPDLYRSNEDYFIDTVRGKLAEHVFQQFYLDIEKKYTFEIDNKIYTSTIETDNGNDLEIIFDVESPEKKYFNNLKIDIKASKEGSEWLLIEKKKSFSDIYVFLKIKFENENFLADGVIKLDSITDDKYRTALSANLLSLFKGKYYGIVAGFAFYSDFIDPFTNKPWFPLKSHHGLPTVDEVPRIFIQDPIRMEKMIEDYHDKLNKRLPTLKAEMNYGIPAPYLRKTLFEWESFFKKIRSVVIPANKSILDQQYPNLMSDRTEAALTTRYTEIYWSFIDPEGDLPF
jgi:hypothetical protein